MTAIQNNLINNTPITEPLSVPPPKTVIVNNLIKTVDFVIQRKEEKMQQALNNKFVRYHPGMIGGDGLTMAYTALNGVQLFVPTLQSISWIGWLTSGAGEIGGLINVWVAYQEFKEAFTAFENKDTLNGWKMVFDASFFMLVGLLMMVVSISTKVTALGGVAAFVTANPWILPVLFFIITLPLICEISIRVGKIAFKKDLASQMLFKDIKIALQDGNQNTAKALAIIQNSPLGSLLTSGSFTNVRDKMEELQADMGVEAGLAVFSLFQQILHNDAEEALRQLEVAEKKVAEWNHAQYVRLFQQVLYILAFVISMSAFNPNANADMINGTVDMAMAAANLIPLGMDICWPFKRNVPMVVPKVTSQWELVKNKVFSGRPLPVPERLGQAKIFVA